MPHGMGNFSFVHQTHTSAAGREGKTQNLAHPKQNKEGKRFSPCKVLSSCWNGFEWGARGGGGSSELWGLSRVGQSSWNGVPPCPRRSGHPEGSLDWRWLLNCSVQAGDARSMSGSTTIPLNHVPPRKGHMCSAPMGCPCPATHIPH